MAVAQEGFVFLEGGTSQEPRMAKRDIAMLARGIMVIGDLECVLLPYCFGQFKIDMLIDASQAHQKRTKNVLQAEVRRCCSL